jgi:acyl-[acyl-carrier-protein]-phospholipid O-acyltransferase/long-chain-fatty-acid--[acyl-carrier-protein] ligase
MVCVAIAVLGVGTALGIHYRPPAAAGLKFEPGVLFIPREIRRLLQTDRSLRAALVVSTIFWLAAAIVQPAVNALGKRQLLVDDRWTSLLVTIISLGIAVGCALAGYLSAGRVHSTVQRTGAWGMFVTLSLLAVRGGPHDHLLGYTGSLIVLVLLGIFTGLFAVPLQVFLQSRPPPRDKGRMIATQNLLNWIGIFASSGIYFAAEYVLRIAGWPNNGVFALTALLILPIALWYRPPFQRGD